MTRALSKQADDRSQTVGDLLSELRGVKRALQNGATAGGQTVPSIAVLPFADMSPEKDQDYFYEGMAEELIDALTKLKGLRVAARTSSFHFKGKNLQIAEIGRTLNVRTILEGSVRKAGNRLRVTAQLVNATDG